jgi:hypothetical protein
MVDLTMDSIVANRRPLGTRWRVHHVPTGRLVSLAAVINAVDTFGVSRSKKTRHLPTRSLYSLAVGELLGVAFANAAISRLRKENAHGRVAIQTA